MTKAEKAEYDRRRYIQIRDSILARARKYRDEHPEKVKASHRVSQEKYRATHSETVLAKDRKVHSLHYRQHKEEVLAANRRYHEEHKDERREYLKRWKASHPDKVKSLHQKRRGLKQAVVSNLSTADARELLRSGCFFCGSLERLTIAHDIPLARRGNTTRGNVFCLCQSCNSKMHTKTLPEMIKQKELF